MLQGAYENKKCTIYALSQNVILNITENKFIWKLSYFLEAES